MSCKTTNCTFCHKRTAFSARQRFCCNACRRGEPMHTDNCTGARQMVEGGTSVAVPLALARLPQPGFTNISRGIQVPRAWLCSNLHDYIAWYITRFHIHVSLPVAMQWGALAAYALDELRDNTPPQQNVMRDRALTIYVLKESEVGRDNPSQINVNTRGLDGRSSLYELHDVTGVDFIVQAVLIGQQLTPSILLEACQNIQQNDLQSFTFVCHGATHRSVGMAFLLSMIVYPNSRIRLSTNRTQLAAVKRGCLFG
jgi:hypothetical protein